MVANQGQLQGQSSPSGEQVVIRYGSLPPGALSTDSELLAARFRRSGSERLRDGAKAFLRRVESLKSRRRKRQNREGVIISGPQVKLLNLLPYCKVPYISIVFCSTINKP